MGSGTSSSIGRQMAACPRGGRAASESCLHDVIGVWDIERDLRHARQWLLVEEVALERVWKRQTVDLMKPVLA